MRPNPNSTPSPDPDRQVAVNFAAGALAASSEWVAVIQLVLAFVLVGHASMAAFVVADELLLTQSPDPSEAAPVGVVNQARPATAGGVPGDRQAALVPSCASRRLVRHADVLL